MSFHDIVLTAFAITFGLLLLTGYSWLVYCAGRAHAVEIIVETYKSARDHWGI